MRRFVGRIVRRHPEGITISMVILVSLAFAIITQGSWVSVGNMQSLSQLTAVLAVMAFGEAIVIATGEIDISVGSVSGIGALAFLGLAPVMGSGPALLAALACGILIGVLNGVFVALLGLPSLLVTLGTLFLFQGNRYAVRSLYPARYPEFSHHSRRPTPMVHTRCRAHCCVCELSGSHFDEISSQEITSLINIYTRTRSILAAR
jgi:ribose/xylose/arabinose/galactoside ABC-type transport system permease subunit